MGQFCQFSPLSGDHNKESENYSLQTNMEISSLISLIVDATLMRVAQITNK